ncbi:MAG: hypothetical protein P1U89_09535 [Verrucomicrobiales bacterium]|nr:hypothetical protein [Verrucomicrobiales bacterium]
MDFIQNFRTFLDSKLLLEEFLVWAISLAALGFLIGLITAFILWYRSARRIQALKDEQLSLRDGDIDIRDVEEKAVDSPAISKPEKPEPEPEKPETEPGIGVTIPAAVGAGVGAAAMLANRDKDEEKLSVETAPEPLPATQDFEISDVYTSPPADRDDLTLLEGIDEERAAELNEAGIYKFSQLEGLNEEDRRKFGFRFGWKDINWGAWAATAAGVGILAKGTQDEENVGNEDFELTTTMDADSPEVENLTLLDGEQKEKPPFGFIGDKESDDVDQETETLQVTAVPDDADDLTQLEGIDEEKAAELHRAGIYKFSQLEALSDEDRKKFNFSDIDWGKWGTLGALGAGAVGAGLLKEDDTEEEEETTVELTETVDESDHDTETPDDADDFTQLEGIDEERAAELRRAGIYKFSQLEALSDEDRKKFNFPDIDWGKWGTLGALGAGAVGAGLLKEDDTEEEEETTVELTETVDESDDDFTIDSVYTEAPDDADDFTQLEGIDEEGAAELHRAGIYKFSQLEELSDEDRKKFSRKFNFPDIDWGKWGTLGALGAGAVGAGLLSEGDNEDETAPIPPGATTTTYPDINWGDGTGTVSDTSSDDSDDDQDLTFTAPPADADDLTLLEGIDEEKAAALNEAGIYKFSQLEELDEEQRAKFSERFKFPDLDWGKWGAIGALGTVAGASLLGDDEAENEPSADTEFDVQIDEEPDPVVAEIEDEDEGDILSTETKKVNLAELAKGDVKPDWTWGYTFNENGGEGREADDLTQLDGISEEDAARLNAEGVFTIKQLEELPEAKREEVKSRFGWGDIDWSKWGAAGAAATGLAAGGGALAANTDSDGEEIDESEPETTVDLSAEVEDQNKVESDWTWGYKFKDKPEDADDLTLMEGVSIEDAEELNRQGVYTFKQLENLPEEKQAEVRSKFGWDTIDWGKWGTLTTLGTAAAAGAVIAKDGDKDEEVDVQPAEETVPEAHEDETSVWEIESDKIAASTVTIDTTEKYGELSLSKEDFNESITEEFPGEAIDIHSRYGIIYPSPPEQIDDLTKVRGIGLATEKQLNKHGIYRFKQIANWNAGAIEGISTDLDLGTRIRDDEWVSQARAFVGDEVAVAESDDEDPTDYETLIADKYAGEDVEFKKGLGILYHKAPDHPDDLTEINGIGESLQRKLNEYGVFQFRQLADWNENNIAAFNDRLSFSGRIERDQWVEQARKFSERASTDADYEADSNIPLPDIATYDSTVAKFAGQNVEVDQAAGVIYKTRPDQADDLKQIRGIGNRIEKDLNDNGVYRFSQIAGWNDYNIREFNERLDLKGRIERDHWVSQAEELAEESDKLQSRYGALLSGEFANESVTVKPGFGPVYTQAPESIDDLTEINGIGPVTESQLNDFGVYQFKQIANWDEEAVETIEEAIDGPGRITRNQWIEQAKEFISAPSHDESESEPGKPENMSYLETLGNFDGENVDIDDNFGVIYTGRPTYQDDLKRIRGVGKYLEKELNDRGVYRFKQIANWNDYNVWAFGKDLAFPGRITREKWVSQAKELAELEDYRAESEKLVKSEYDGKGVSVDPELGVVYRNKPDQVDDLTQLDGIDEEAAERLNSEGIYTIEQVQSLKGPQQKSFASRFGLENIAWAKWSGISALGAIGAAGVSAAAAVKEEGSDLVETVVEKAVEIKESITESDELPIEEPKGIFGTGDEDEDGSGKRRVAFIMDVSRSLTPAQLRLSKTELSAAVSNLPEGSLYQVIFFSGPTWFAHQRMIEGGARGEDVVIADGDEKIRWKSGFGGFEFEGGNENLPGSAWREATPENIAATLDDIEAVGKSYGTTWHLPLTMALNLEPVPKNIYFLTDGETARQDQVAQEMIDMAKDRGGITKINTIALMVPGASVPLHRMAKGTNGEYSLVIAGGKVLKDDELSEYLAEKDISLDD